MCLIILHNSHCLMKLLYADLRFRFLRLSITRIYSHALIRPQGAEKELSKDLHDQVLVLHVETSWVPTPAIPL